MASKDKPKKQKKHDLRTTHLSEEKRETDFGTDQEVPRKLSQGASPNPEHRRTTYKSMKHKVLRALGLEKGSFGTQADDGVKQEVGVQVMTVHTLSPDETSSFRSSSPSAASNENIELIGSYVSVEMEESLVVGGQKLGPQIREECARPKSKETETFKLVPKLKTETKKLSDDLQSAQHELRQKQSAVEELQEKLSSKSKDLEELKAKLDKRDMDHERHIAEKVNELKTMHQQKEKSLDDLLKREKQTHAHQLKEMKKEYQNSLDKKEKSFAGLLEKEQKELQVEFERKEVLAKDKYEAAVKDTIAKEKEVHKLQLIIQEKQQELTFSKHEKGKLQKEVDATKQQQKESKKETTSKISLLEQQLQKAEEELEIQIDKKQKELNSQHQQQVHQLEMQAKAKLDEAKAELDEANAQIERLKEELHIQVQQNMTQTNGASSMADEVIEGNELETVTVVLNEQDQKQPCLLEAQVKENNCQAQDTKMELKDEQRIQDVITKAKEDQEKLYEQLKSDFDEQLSKLMGDHRKEIEMLKEKKPQAEKASQSEDLTSEVVAQPQLSKTETENYMPDPVANHTPAISNDVECMIQEIADLKEENKGLTEQLTSLDEMIEALQSKNDQLNKKYEQLEVQARAKHELSKSPPSKDNALETRTDAEKLRGELEELTNKAELEAEAYQQRADKLEVQVKELTKKVSEISATNEHLQGVVKTALEETPPSASGIQAGDEGKTAKMLQQIRAKYLELSMQVVTTREDHEKQIEEYEVKLTEWQKRYYRKKQELTEKVIEKDNQLKQQRRDGGPPTAGFSIVEFLTPSKEISKQVEELRATLEIRDEEVQSLNAKVQAFQEVASQRQKLHEHTRTSSAVVAQLRKELEESKKEKTEVEDELLLLKNEFEAEKQNHLSRMHELARSQSLVASLRTKAKPHQLGTDDQDELKLLKAEAKLFQIELTELRRKAESSKKFITSLGKLKLSLERKLKQSNEERDELARENIELRTSKHTIQEQVNKFGDLKTQVEVTQENLAVLVQTVVTKTEENEDLRQQIKELEDELEVIKFQAFQYEQDFKEERQAREQAMGAKDSDLGRFTLEVQTLTEQLEMAELEAENERKEKQAVISKLEASFVESQELKSQLKQAQGSLDNALKSHSEALERMEAEKLFQNKQLEQPEINFANAQAPKSKELETTKTQLASQLLHMKSESKKYQEQLQRSEAVYLQRQDEFLQQIEHLKGDAAKQQSELQDKAQIVAAQNLSLDDQLEKTKIELKAKEKNLEIMAAEKQLLEENLRIEKDYNTALNQELSKTKANGDRIANGLQDSRQRLETSVADTEHLHDEVLAKTAQVMQYTKQTDSFKLKLEEANDRLVKTQKELQRCQALIRTMEEDQQDQTWKITELEKYRIDSDSTIRGLKINLQQCTEQNRMLSSANQQLEARLSNSDELAMYSISQLPEFGECQGFGSYGSIYHIQLHGIKCVAKRIHDILLGQGNQEAVSLEDKCAAYEKFRRECILLSRIRHPNIVQFMGVHYGPQREYGRELTLVMECLHMNLDDCVRLYSDLPIWLKLSIFVDISQGLSHLHSQKIVHRDLTAKNILLTSNFHAKIADLGVSKIINVHPLAASKQSKIPGTLGYMPPEALVREPRYTSSLDIFSFGVIILFVMVQEYPEYYEDPRETHIQRRMAYISRLPPTDPVRQLICHCLQDEPQRRPTIVHLNTTLLKLAEQHPRPFSNIMDLQRQPRHQDEYRDSSSQLASRQQPATPPVPLPRHQSQGYFNYH